MKRDVQRALKWTQRADDLARLADEARVEHVADLLTQHAAWSYGMAELWGGAP